MDNKKGAVVVEALQELLRLKEWKDKYGKDLTYQRDQPIAWEKASEALKQSLAQPQAQSINKTDSLRAEWGLRTLEPEVQPNLQPQAPVVPEGFVPSMNEIDRIRIDWCVRTLHDGYKNLGRDKPMGDFYPAVISVVGALKRTLEPNLAEPEPVQRDECPLLEDLRDTVLHQRGALAENGMTGDQVNDVLKEIDERIICAASKGKS